MTRVRDHRSAVSAAVGLCLACSACSHEEPGGFSHFVQREGARLVDGGRTFRFISYNIPNLHYVEDDLRFEQSMPFRLPDAFEIDDALATIDQVGGQVVRMYALSVRKKDDPADIPRHVLGPGQFNEDAFVVLDRVVAAASRHRVRLIIPFIDQWSWWGGTAELAGFRGKKPEEFWTDPEVFEDYKAIVSFVINRRNTITGVTYRDDKAILAWETGNELKGPEDWTLRAASYIKSLDPQHILIDGSARDQIAESALADPNVDFVQTHHYDKDPREMIGRIQKNAKLAAGRKPYHVGEFGFLGTEALRTVLDAVIDDGMTGALLWSLRYRSREGGFYWHHEPYGGDLFKSYHWPGFDIGESFDERRMVRLLRDKAYQIRGLTPPPLPVPAAPHLLTVSEGGQLTWRGSVGAERYDVQRAASAMGPWAEVGRGISEAQVQFRPLFVDESVEPGRPCWYRVIARNEAGPSLPSNIVGPVTITHRTLVDELWNDSRIFLVQGTIQLQQNDARKFKEDCHRIAGEKGTAVVYLAGRRLRAARVFAFSQAAEPDLRLSVSKDCRNFEAVQPEVKRTTTYGEPVYAFRKADLYVVNPPGDGYRYVRIEFQGDAQLSRVEIDHD